MYRRPREYREMAGWQCAAGRAILRLEAREFAPLIATTKNTILRYERGEFMPRPQTTATIKQVLRQRGVVLTFDKFGEPKGLFITWKAYARAYPERPATKHRKRPEEVGAEIRAHPELDKPVHPPGVRLPRHPPELPQQRVVPTPQPVQTPASLAAMEEQTRRLMAELRQLKGEPAEDDWSA